MYLSPFALDASVVELRLLRPKGAVRSICRFQADEITLPMPWSRFSRSVPQPLSADVRS
jgi:hypothetical protein